MCHPWLASLALLLFLAPGCGPPGLVEGSEVMAYTDEPVGVPFWYGQTGKRGFFLGNILPGEHVQYLGETNDPLHPNDERPRRVFRIKVLRGELAGTVGTISRENSDGTPQIRPIPR